MFLLRPVRLSVIHNKSFSRKRKLFANILKAIAY